MGRHRRLQVLGEVCIDRRRWLGWTDHGYRLRVALDYDLASGLDLFEDRSNISGQVALSHVQQLHTWMMACLIFAWQSTWWVRL